MDSYLEVRTLGIVLFGIVPSRPIPRRLGDNIYADVGLPQWKKFINLLFPESANIVGEIGETSTLTHIGATPDRIAALYEKQKRESGYDAFRKTGVPIFPVWDDHDYGINDGDRLYAYKKESQKLFLDFFDVPGNDPRRSREGIYRAHVFRVASLRVKLLLLDVRTHRDPWNETSSTPALILGQDQWTWLENELLHDDKGVDLVILVTGIQVLPLTPYVASAESWARDPAAKRALMRLLVDAQRRRGTATLLLSGDVHHAEINEELCAVSRNATKTHRIVDVTSSGMTHAWQARSKNWPKPRLAAYLFHVAFDLGNAISDAIGVNLMRTRQRRGVDVEGLKYAERNFGEIEVYRDDESGDVRVAASVFGVDGVEAFRHSWSLRELGYDKDTPQHSDDEDNLSDLACAPQYYVHPTESNNVDASASVRSIRHFASEGGREMLLERGTRAKCILAGVLIVALLSLLGCAMVFVVAFVRKARRATKRKTQ